jgi:hypothetical protein
MCVHLAFRLREKPISQGAVAVAAPATVSITPCVGNETSLTAPSGYLVMRLSVRMPAPETTAFRSPSCSG